MDNSQYLSDSSSSLERLDEDYLYKDFNVNHKRRKLEEDFEAMSIEDYSDNLYFSSKFSPSNIQCRDLITNPIGKCAKFIESFNRGDEYSKQAHSKRTYWKQEYSKKGFGCGKRKRCKIACKDSLNDFSELKRQIKIAESHLKKLSVKKVLFGRNDENPAKNQKKRIEKEDSKNLPIALATQVTYEKKVIQMIIKLKEQFPKVYKKLMNIFSKQFLNDDLIITDDQRATDFNNLNDVDYSCKDVVDEFVMKANKYTINSNSKLTNEVIINMMRIIETDYEMNLMEPPNAFHHSNTHQFAIEYAPYSSEGCIFINPISSCIVEEIN